MKIIVTGGAGFIGSHLVQTLLNNSSIEVCVLDDFSTGSRDFLSISNPKLKVVEVDISDWSSLSDCYSFFKDAYGVFHLAAQARIQPSLLQPRHTHDSNINGTFNLLEMMRMANVTRIVYAGSSSCYGFTGTGIAYNLETDPDNCLTPYAISKKMAGEYCKTWGLAYGIKNCELRFNNVYGPREWRHGPYATVVAKFFRQALLEECPLTIVGDGGQKRDFTHVFDIVKANIKAMKCLDNISGLKINVGTGINHSVLDVATYVKAAIEEKYPEYKIDFEHTGQRPGEARESRADQTRMQKYFSWVPEKTNMQENIRELTLYYAAQYGIR